MLIVSVLAAYLAHTAEKRYKNLSLNHCNGLLAQSPTCEIISVDDVLFGYDVVVRLDDKTQCLYTYGTKYSLKFSNLICEERQ